MNSEEREDAEAALFFLQDWTDSHPAFNRALLDLSGKNVHFVRYLKYVSNLSFHLCVCLTLE